MYILNVIASPDKNNLQYFIFIWITVTKFNMTYFCFIFFNCPSSFTNQ